MSSVAPPGAEAERVSTGDSIRDWVASLLRYAELRLRLLGLESKDAGLHLLIVAIVKDGLAVTARVSVSLRHNTWSWVSLAAIVGWVLARLPLRRKKIYLEAGRRRRLKGEEKQTERKRDLAWMIWDGVWSLAKPLLTAYLGRKLAQTTGSSNWRKG